MVRFVWANNGKGGGMLVRCDQIMMVSRDRSKVQILFIGEVGTPAIAEFVSEEKAQQFIDDIKVAWFNEK